MRNRMRSDGGDGEYGGARRYLSYADLEERYGKSRVTIWRWVLHAVLIQAPDGIPDEWAQGIADLLAMPPHPDWPETAWMTLQYDALAFLKDWTAQAHALDWTALGLFGVHATASRARLDGMGLVPLLNGRPVTTITESTAVISVASGGAQTYCRPSTWPTERCLVWKM